DLPLWGFVDELHSDKNTDSKHILFTHMNITLQYNKDQIIHFNLTQENPKSLEVDFDSGLQSQEDTNSDDLPLWGFVGELHSDKNTDSKHILFTHMNITLQYNKDQIIHFNLTQENPKSLEVGKTLDMTYSVTWTETNGTLLLLTSQCSRF
nr:transmembrane 9 superfamily member 1-like [Tanacetum cinerariifolium]